MLFLGRTVYFYFLGLVHHKLYVKQGKSGKRKVKKEKRNDWEKTWTQAAGGVRGGWVSSLLFPFILKFKVANHLLLGLEELLHDLSPERGKTIWPRNTSFWVLQSCPLLTNAGIFFLRQTNSSVVENWFCKNLESKSPFRFKRAISRNLIF